MATITAPAAKLTYEQFRERYKQFDKAYEYWYGEAVPKGLPTVIHGLLQMIIMVLLKGAGYISASEVELRMEPGARPRPDVIASIASSTAPTQPLQSLTFRAHKPPRTAPSVPFMSCHAVSVRGESVVRVY